MVEVKEYKCPNCEGQLKFDSQTQKLKCQSCGSLFDPEMFTGAKNYHIELTP